MGRIRSKPIDLTPLAEEVAGQMKGWPLTDALDRFVRIYQVPRKAQLRSSVEENLRNPGLVGLLITTHLHEDGRVTATTPGLEMGGDNELHIWTQVLRLYLMRMSLGVHGRIVPALAVLLSEHRIPEAEVCSLVRRSGLFPLERRYLVAHGLYIGFDGDFTSAMHVLIPQWEYLVRRELNLDGVTTTVRNTDGTETESGLSALMGYSQTDTVVGEELAFEIRALFSDRHGLNLRNNIAHGLLNIEDKHSEAFIYAWWLMLRLVTINT